MERHSYGRMPILCRNSTLAGAKAAESAGSTDKSTATSQIVSTANKYALGIMFNKTSLRLLLCLGSLCFYR